MIISIIFSYFSMFIICKSELIIFSSIYNSLLNSCIYFSKTHGSRRRPESGHHFYICRALLYSYFFTFQIIRCFYRGCSVKISCSGVKPRYSFKSRLFCRCIYVVCEIFILHYFMIEFNVFEKVGYAEDLIYVVESLKVSSTCHGVIYRSCLNEFYGFYRGS